MSEGASGVRLAIDTAKIAAIYLALGPLVGLVTFSVAAGLLVVSSGNPEGFWLTPFFLLYGLVFAHFIGADWALLAALVAAGISLTTRSKSRWIGPASGAVSALASTFSGTFKVLGPAREMASANADIGWLGFTLVLVVVHLVAGSFCWLVARRTI